MTSQDMSEFKQLSEQAGLREVVVSEGCLMLEEVVADHPSRDIGWRDHPLTEAEQKREHDSKDGMRGHSTADAVDLHP